MSETQNNVYEVLRYIFDYYLDETRANLDLDQSKLVFELTEVGFRHDKVQKAFKWLESLVQDNHLGVKQVGSENHTVRIYSEAEQKRLSQKALRFLAILEQNRTIDGLLRERIIDRALALEVERVRLDQLQWVTLMVLANQKEAIETLDWIGDYVLNEKKEKHTLH